MLLVGDEKGETCVETDTVSKSYSAQELAVDFVLGLPSIPKKSLFSNNFTPFVYKQAWVWRRKERREGFLTNLYNKFILIQNLYMRAMVRDASVLEELKIFLFKFGNL